MENLDELNVHLVIDSKLTESEKQKIYLDIINSINDHFLYVTTITNNNIEVFNQKQGFINRKKENNG